MSSPNQKFNTSISPTWCPGCGNYGIWQALKTALFELNLDPHQVYISYDIGCFGNGTNFTKTYTFHSLHGRALPPAVGAKIANKDLVVLALAGDGGAYGEGVQHLIHTARYNVNVTYLVANNQRFSLTTGQASPTTDKNIKTPTTPFGEIKKPINPLLLSLTSGTSFLARGFAGDQKHLTEIIKQAIKHKGFSHIDILQPCISFNKENTFEWYRSVVYKLEDHRYTPDDYNRAVGKAQEFEVEGKMPIGVIYKEDRASYENLIPQLKGEPLCNQ
ncbi:MAG: thiamine pyrophosphate-dependent enzyme [Candidatus Kuenenbacteria bacterium]